MRGKTQNIVFAAVLVALAGGGYFVHSLAQKRLREELTEERAKVERDLEKVLKADAEAKSLADAKRSEARKAEADQKRAEADRAKAEAVAETARNERDALVQKKEVAEAEAVRSANAAKAAEAEKKRLEAEKAASEAKAKELAEQRAKDEAALKIAVAANAKAQADAARALAEQKKADAEKAKSENELKIAEKNAAARRDERLLMYKRGGTSEAERKEVQRAEKLLALWEAGQLSPENLAAAGEIQLATNAVEEASGQPEDAALAEAKKEAMKEKPQNALDPRDERLKAMQAVREEKLLEMRRRRDAESIKTIEPLLKAAEREGRVRDADYYRKALRSLVPGYDVPAGS